MKKIFKPTVLTILVISILMMSFSCTFNNKNGIKVTIDLQNGTEPTVSYVKEGSTVTLPEVEDEPYRTFRGWFTDYRGLDRFDDKAPITAEITIYACWNELTGNVTFNFNYDGAPDPISKKMKWGELINAPEDIPERECWDFVGWFTDEELTVPFDPEQALAAESLTIYAGWKLEEGHEHSYAIITTPCCTTDGYDTHICACGDSYVDNQKAMSGHSFDFTDVDYIGMARCQNAGCTEVSRRESERIYEDDFVYNFNDEKKAEIDGRYDRMLKLLAEIDRYDENLHGYVKDSDRYKANLAFEELYEQYYDDVNYAIEQYQYAYVFYCVNDNDENTAVYEAISEYYTASISNFYKLYRLIYETEYREYFFAEDGGWTEEDIKQALILSDSYGSDKYKEINDRIDEIEIQFRDIKSQGTSATVLELYEEFVTLKNQLAKLAGYDNYIEYAYENVYHRDYTPADTAKMREFVKQYLKDVMKIAHLYYSKLESSAPVKGTEAYDVYNAIMNKSIFKSAETADIVSNYLKVMNSTDAGEQEIDFYLKANDLFKNGNYYTGKYQGAFSYWVDAHDTSILYFGPGSYSSAFTFVHEFGHYYQNVYNHGISISYDLEEVYSQGNEMLFLSYLDDMLDNDVLSVMYDDVYYETIFNSMAIVMLATAVDEFEYCVYTGTTPEGEPAEYGAEDYDALFKSIMSTYGINGILNSAYWRYVVIESPCYYISYAMSAIPCLELLSIADTEGFEAAQQIYFNFLTFTEDEANIEIDELGDKSVTIGYADTLKYVGLHSIFEADAYTTIANYFKQQKDFSYGEKAA